ncbi:hypothetical protein QG37_06366 [Candidozyma auris]|nr:hypothetical protein QG37_06366 [[Candida] auris]
MIFSDLVATWWHKKKAHCADPVSPILKVSANGDIKAAWHNMRIELTLI